MVSDDRSPQAPLELLHISDSPEPILTVPTESSGGAATGAARARTRSGEMAAALRKMAAARISPSELLAELAEYPAWRVYLEQFEPGRGQAAAIGRYLRDLGLEKCEHHRVRGSLYDRLEALALVENQGAGSSTAATSAAPAGAATEVLEAGFGERRVAHSGLMDGPIAATASAAAAPALPGSAADHAAPARPEPSPSATPVDTEAAVPGAEPMNGSGHGERRRAHDAMAAATRGARDANPGPNYRPGGVVGWRRRATDLLRADGTPVISEPPATPPAPPPAPPVWVGSGSYSAVPAPYYMHELTAPAEETGLPLASYWVQVRRHWARIAAFVVACTAVTTILTLRIPKQYESVATMRMDFNQPMLPGVTSGTADESADSEDVIVATEVLEVTQRAVVLEAISEGNLDRDPHLLPVAFTEGQHAPDLANTASARDNALVGVIQAGTTVVQPNDTHDIEVHFRSHDPNTSAAVANALANAVINHDFKTRSIAQQQALDWMTKQFNDVKARVEQEQQQLLAYEHNNDIINPDDKTNIENARLQQLTSEFLQAQANRVHLQAEEDAVKSNSLDALLSSDQGAALRPAYDAWRTAQSNLDLIQTRDGPNNPAYQSAQTQLNNAQRQLASAEHDLAAEIDSNFQKAQRIEQADQSLLTQAKNDAQDLTGKTIDFDFLKRNEDADMTLYNQLMSEIKQDNLGASMSDTDMRITDPATPNSVPVYPNVRRNLALALLASLMLGCAIAIVSGLLDRSFTSPERVEQILGIPLLGALPVIKDRTSVIELADELRRTADGAKGTTRSPFAEAVLMLHTAVRYAAPQSLRSLNISSAQPQEGKSVTAGNLAVAMALHGSKVLLIDADIRRPTLHRIFNLPNQVGLSNLLRRNAPLEECFQHTMVEKLYLMPAGPAVPNPSELLATMLAEVLTPLYSEFDFVLVDSPPILGFADATTISTLVDGTLMLARAGETPRELVLAALQPLKRVRARVLGLVLNQVSSSLSPYYSYYRDHYARYYSSGQDEAAKMRA